VLTIAILIMAFPLLLGGILTALSMLFLVGTIIFAGTYLSKEEISDLIRRFIERREKY
jgi:uncharacterized membrane protein